jgi:hypothetical protein
MTCPRSASLPNGRARRRWGAFLVLAALAAVLLPACGKQAGDGGSGAKPGEDKQTGGPNAAPAGEDKQAVLRLKEQSVNNLKQIMLALQIFHDTYKTLPPAAICDKKTGKPLLSWRVAILPYMEQVNLYKQFKMDEPWDSPHNKKLADTIVPVFAPPGAKSGEGSRTYYRAFLASPDSQIKTAWEMKPNKDAMFGATGAGLRGITDGSTNTLGVVEAAEATPWTKPEPLPYDAKKPLPKLGGLFKDGFNAGMMDASVRFISNRIDETSLRALITANGGEIIPFEELEKKGLIK